MSNILKTKHVEGLDVIISSLGIYMNPMPILNTVDDDEPNGIVVYVVSNGSSISQWYLGGKSGVVDLSKMTTTFTTSARDATNPFIAVIFYDTQVNNFNIRENEPAASPTEPTLSTHEIRIGAVTVPAVSGGAVVEPDPPVATIVQASSVQFTSTATIAATTVQTAIEELGVMSRTETYIYTFTGEVKVASGDTDFVIPFKIRKSSSESAKVSQVDYKINSGTGANIKLTLNGSDMTGFTNMSVTSSWGNTNPTDVTLADGDIIGLIVNSVDTLPRNMVVCIHIIKTKA